MRRFALAVALAFASSAGAQGATFKGVVLTDSTERPIAGAVVRIEQLNRESTSDSLGRFQIAGVTPGVYTVSAKKIGFTSFASRVQISGSSVVEADLLLTPAPGAQALPDVVVETKAAPRGKLIEFDERRQSGNGGRFLTQADLEKRPFAKLAETLRTIPGLEVQTNRKTGTMIAVAGRMSQPGGGLAGPMALLPCPAAVVLDGILVYGAGDDNEPLFDVNKVDPTSLAGVEFYNGPASIPAKYNATRHTCGLLVLWTK